MIDPGSMQKYVAISSTAAMVRKPQNLSWEQAAAIPLVYMTVYGCLVDVGHLPFRVSEIDKGKNSVLILGGSGGAGSQAIQLAKMMGLNVVTSCSKASEEMVKKLGADEVSSPAMYKADNEVIDYRSQNVGEVARGSKYAPFAVVLDCVGGTEVIPYMDDLLLEDPKRPDLGVYVSISGDSK
jgi:NADPH:quinone reductase-like Zn-dependent oxidoreductase